MTRGNLHGFRGNLGLLKLLSAGLDYESDFALHHLI